MILSVPFAESITLENQIALLRPLQPLDYQYLENFAMFEPDIWQFSLVPVSGKQGLKNYIEQATQAKQNQTEYTFIVFDKSTQTYAGCTRFYNIRPLQNEQHQDLNIFLNFSLRFEFLRPIFTHFFAFIR